LVETYCKARVKKGYCFLSSMENVPFLNCFERIV
jgi:hypothetical protein